MLLSLAWRNIWRSPLRSMVVISASALGLFGAIFATAFMLGMSNQTVDAAISDELTHVQMHNPGFIENQEIRFDIPGYAQILDTIETDSRVEAVSIRTRVNAMISSARTVCGVSVVGIDPQREARVTDIKLKCIEGSYFSGTSSNPILVSEILAKKLNVSIRKKVVMTFQNSKNEISGGAFRIAGIFKTQNSTFDGISVFVNRNDLAKLLEIESAPVHEIAIKLKSNRETVAFRDQYSNKYHDLSIRDWKHIQPEIAIAEDVMYHSMYLFDCVIMLALLFVIVNTMLMAVLERSHEFGMLLAVGMSKTRIFIMIMIETIIVSASSGFFGMLAGGITVLYFRQKGIDLSKVADGLKAVGYNPVVYPEINASLIFEMGVMIFLTGIAASIYPAMRALKIDMAQSVRVQI